MTRLRPWTPVQRVGPAVTRELRRRPPRKAPPNKCLPSLYDDRRLLTLDSLLLARSLVCDGNSMQ